MACTGWHVTPNATIEYQFFSFSTFANIDRENLKYLLLEASDINKAVWVVSTGPWIDFHINKKKSQNLRAHVLGRNLDFRP